MAMSDQMDIKSQPRIGMWCLIAWCVAVAFILAAALAQGVQLSEFIGRADESGHISLWQALVFSVSMSAFGFWMALTTKLGRIPEDPAGIAFNLKLYAKGGGWIFAIGGIFVALRIIGLLQAE
jgi:hypothetical protein